MIDISVKEAAAIVGGTLCGENNADASLNGVVIDSRLVVPGSMFAALKGEKTDGHEYMEKAFSLGASCCLAERVPENVTGCVILVPDVRAALAVLAADWRSRFTIPVIGISGSVGKTTAKEMIASVLAEKYKVLKTEKNLNNELGVPLTLFRLGREHTAAVVEMGISDFGEMTRLAAMVQPTMAVYTVIGFAHIEHLRDLAGVLKAKTEMVSFLPEDGTVFLNADDAYLASYACPRRAVLYGTAENAAVRAENVTEDLKSGLSCDIVCGERRIALSVPAYGRHVVYAALEGAAVGMEMGLSDAQIAAGAAKFMTVGRRANICDTGFLTLIDDCYNANPTSVKCGIDSLADLPGRKVCVLGDMLEMGEEKEAVHASVGEYAAGHGVALLITVGELSRHTALGAKDIQTAHFDTNAEAIEALPKLLCKGDTVLVKASNYMRFDEISEAIKKL